jgi:hypothetical protein
MRRWSLSWCLLLASGLSLAESGAVAEPNAFQAIAQQRVALRLQQLQVEAQCYQRFSVSDCLEASRLRYRAQLNDLKRQENLLKAEQRHARGARELERLDANLSNAKLDQDQLARQEKADAHLLQQTESEQARQADEAAREQARLARQAQAQERQKQHEQVLDALRAKRIDEVRQRALYEEKLEAAAKRKQEQNAKDAQQQGTSAPLLPR